MNNSNRAIKKIINRAGQNPAYITASNQAQFAPFALFDAGRVPSHEPLVIDWHPHSGVATITFPYDCNLHHNDSAGNSGIILDQGLQWMSSGKGIWHKESYLPTSKNHMKKTKLGIMQLWLMLDPEEETQEVNYFNLQPDQIPQINDQNGSVTRVLLGDFHGLRAQEKIKHNASYLDVHLKKGQQWQYQPANKQSRGFVYPRIGTIEIDSRKVESQQLALLEESEHTLNVLALEDCQFVVATTEPWPYPVVQHYGQIHTSKASLKIGSAHIQKTKLKLIEQLNREASQV